MSVENFSKTNKVWKLPINPRTIAIGAAVGATAMGGSNASASEINDAALAALTNSDNASNYNPSVGGSFDGLTISEYFQTDSDDPIGTPVAMESFSNTDAQAEQVVIFPQSPESIELVIPGQAPEVQFYEDFSFNNPGWNNLISQATPQVQNFINSRYPGLTIDSFSVVVPAIFEENEIKPTQTPDTQNSQKVNLLFSHQGGGVGVEFDPQNPDNPWSLNGYDNIEMVSAIVGPGYAELLQNPSRQFTDMISNLYVYPDTATGNLVVVDRVFPRLGAISQGFQRIGENGNRHIEWVSRYQIQDNVRLFEQSMEVDGDIGKIPAPGYVLINDTLPVEDMGITWNLATVMSADPDDPHHTLTTYEFTDEFRENLTNFTRERMQDSIGMTITIRIVDDQDPTTLSYLRTNSLDNYTFLQHRTNWNGILGSALGAEPAQDGRLDFNIFVARDLLPTDHDMGFGMSRSIMNAVAFIKTRVYEMEGGDAYGAIPDKTEMALELGATYDPATEPSMLVIHNPN